MAPPTIDFDAVTFGGVATVAGAVAELFALLESATELATVAVLLMDVPAVAAGSIVALSVKVAAFPAVIDGSEQVTVPLDPAGGVVHDHPPGEEREAKRSDAGSTSVIVPAGASLRPLLVSRTVYRRVPRGRASGRERRRNVGGHREQRRGRGVQRPRKRTGHCAVRTPRRRGA